MLILSFFRSALIFDGEGGMQDTKKVMQYRCWKWTCDWYAFDSNAARVFKSIKTSMRTDKILRLGCKVQYGMMEDRQLRDGLYCIGPAEKKRKRIINIGTTLFLLKLLRRVIHMHCNSAWTCNVTEFRIQAWSTITHGKGMDQYTPQISP